MIKMWKTEDSGEEWEMKLKLCGSGKFKKLRTSVVSRSPMKLWTIRAITTVLLWTFLVHLMSLGETWGPRLLTSWTSCFSHQDVELTSVPANIILPPKSKFIISLISAYLLLRIYIGKGC